MNYKLALSLKDAGFPQMDAGNTRFIMPKDILWQNELDGPICINSNQIWNEDNYSEQDCAYLPSLEELIEACGEGFFGLEKVQNYMVDGNKVWDKGWQALPFPLDYSKAEFAQTSIEAVANLWLALNAK